MTGDIVTFPGGLFTQPILLELSQNYCSHKCAVCFANLNKPDRKSKIKQTISYLKRLFSNELKCQYPNITTHLLLSKHPILMSNHTDPFAESNYRETAALVEIFAAQDIPVAFQTRGATSPKAKEVLHYTIDILKPSCWYISINQLKDETRAKLEKGSPPIPERIALIERLVAKGHLVFIGLNPLTPEWITFEEAKELIHIAKSAGAKGIYLQMLHLSALQSSRMLPSEKDAVTNTLIKLAMKPFDSDERDHHRELLRQTWEYGNSIGIPTTFKGDPYPTDYWKPYHTCYKREGQYRTIPTLADLITYMTEQKHEILTFEMFWNFFKPYLPEGVWKLDNFIHAFDKRVGMSYKIPTYMTFKQLFLYIWQDERSILNPTDHPSFEWLVDEDNLEYVDETGLKVMRFLNPSLTN